MNNVCKDKAKLWADLNIVKMVFVCYTEEIGRQLRKSSSLWSRAATPLYIGDLQIDRFTYYSLVV